MKAMIGILLITIFTLTLQADGLTKGQEKRLNSPMVKILPNDLFVIEDYNSINFNQTVTFGNKKLNKIIVKSYAQMKKGTINKEVFISISSDVSGQILDNIFFTKQNSNKIESIDFLTNKPKNIDFIISLNFDKKGINVTMGNDLKKEKQFIPYSELFHSKLKRSNKGKDK